MAEASKLQVSELDFAQIRENFKTFLSTQDQFKDYDTDGSIMSVLLDLLSYNTHYNAFYLNMVSNEMFLDSAVLRNSVVSHAKALGYMPRSRRGAEANVSISLTPTNNPTSVTIEKNTKFNTTVDGVTFTFVTDTAYSSTANGDNATLTFSNVTLKEGQPLTFRYTANNEDDSQRFIIPNRGIDSTSITVTIQESSEDTRQYTYTQASDLLTVNSTSNVYYLEESTDFRPEVKFGDGVYGTKLKTGNLVILGYNVCSGILSNGARTFTPVSTVAGYSGATVTTSNAASGGSDEETSDSIRFNAPKQLAVQNRAVTANDYKRIIERDYPQADSAIVYGGEQADPPEFGKVFIGIKPKSGLSLTTSIKDQIRDDILKKYNVGSITPEFVDLDTIFIKLNTTINYDSRLTTRTSNAMRTAVINTINNFSGDKLEEFNNEFRFSVLTKSIDETDTAILGNDTKLYLVKEFIPTIGSSLTYTINFSNQIHHPHSGYIGAITSTNFSIVDGENVLRTDCSLDDLDGIIRIFRLVNNKKTIVNANLGTIDYISGKIVLNSFNPTAFVGSKLQITSIPESYDIIPLREQIVQISSSLLTVNVNDISSVKSGTQTFTSTS